MHVDIKVVIIGGFLTLIGVFTPLVWPIFFPPTPYSALEETTLKMGDSVRVDGGRYTLQVLEIKKQPHRFKAIIIGGDQFRYDFKTLMKAQRVEYQDQKRKFALHVKDLIPGNTVVDQVTIEIDRLE